MVCRLCYHIRSNAGSPHHHSMPASSVDYVLCAMYSTKILCQSKVKCAPNYVTWHLKGKLDCMLSTIVNSIGPAIVMNVWNIDDQECKCAFFLELIILYWPIVGELYVVIGVNSTIDRIGIGLRTYYSLMNLYLIVDIWTYFPLWNCVCCTSIYTTGKYIGYLESTVETHVFDILICEKWLGTNHKLVLWL